MRKEARALTSPGGYLSVWFLLYDISFVKNPMPLPEIFVPEINLVSFQNVDWYNNCSTVVVCGSSSATFWAGNLEEVRLGVR